MLHIIFLILKILGIVLAVLVGIILFILIVTLFVPIRYQLFGKKEEEEIFVDAKASWLLHLAYARLSFIDNKLWIRFRIAGIVVYDNRRHKDDTRENEIKDENKKEGFDIQPNEKDKNLYFDLEDENEKPKISENKVDILKAEVKKSDSDSEILIDIDEKDESNERIKLDTSIDSESDNNKHSVKQKIDILEYDKQKGNKANKHKNSNVKKINIKNFKINIEDKKISNKEKKKNKIHLKAIPIKLKHIYHRILSFFKSLKEKVKRTKELIIQLLHKKDLIRDFLKDQENKLGLKKVWKSIRRVLKHIAPKKIQGVVRFGTGDPCSTGQALGAMAVFYGFYGDKISIKPNFEEEVLDGELFLKGRIRLITLLIIAIKLIRDKYFIRLIKNAKQLKEEF